MEVRCCCRPDKLLGYLPSPSDGARQSTFPLAPALQPLPVPGPRLIAEYLPDTVRLNVQAFSIPDPEYTPDSIFGMYITGLAYRADGLELEQLQRIPGFLTAAHEYSNAISS